MDLKCNICGKELNDDEIIPCPNCKKDLHSKCVEERNISYENIAGSKRQSTAYYYHCPHCGEKFLEEKKEKI